MLHRSEPNFVLNGSLDLGLFNEIVETDISPLQPPILQEKGQ